jgi:hypothetical protein
MSGVAELSMALGDADLQVQGFELMHLRGDGVEVRRSLADMWDAVLEAGRSEAVVLDTLTMRGAAEARNSGSIA